MLVLSLFGGGGFVFSRDGGGGFCRRRRLLLVVAVAVAEAEVVGRLSAWLVEAAATLFEVAAEVSVIGSGGVGFIRGFCWRRWRHCLCSVMVAAATLFGGGNIGS